MAYKITGPEYLGLPAISDSAAALATGTTIGQEVEAVDNSSGYWGKFKLLYGVASTVVGSLVTFDPATGLTTLCPSTANLGQPVAVAMNANTVTTTASWYQVQGVATINKITTVNFTPAVALYISATAGKITSLAVSGKQVLPARTVNAATVASATTTVLVNIQYPFAQGRGGATT